MHAILLFLVLVVLVPTKFSSMHVSTKTKNGIDIDLNHFKSKFRQHFWHYSGLSPPSHDPVTVRNYLLSPNMKINLAFISGLPTGSILYERIHWLFSLVDYNPEESSFDFTLLDKLMDWMKNLDLLPIFELMGAPLNTSEFLQSYKPWENLCYSTVKHYAERYGIDYLKKWRFETWNEIDSKQYNVLGFNITGYLNYVNDCFIGVDKASKSLIKMGPGGVLRYQTNYSSSFLNFCHEKPDKCNLKFITFHQKGYPINLWAGAHEYRKKLNQLYPKFINVSMANDEADVMSSWWIPTSWRSDVRYPAKMSRLVNYLYSDDPKLGLKFISFDNSFINELPFTFEQRTLLTRFEMKESSSLQFIEKPSYTVMGMMNLLGDYVIEAVQHPVHKEITCMITSNHERFPSQISGIITTTNDYDMSETNQTIIFRLKLILPMAWERAKFKIYMISNSLPHPAKVYDQIKNPFQPNARERMLMRSAQGPHLIEKGEAKGRVDLNIALPNPSIALINICASSIDSPSQVNNVIAINITYNEVLLIWKHYNGQRCIKTYIVEFRRIGTKSFIRVNNNDIFFCHFHFAIEEDLLKHPNNRKNVSTSELTRGWYRVTAVDYFGRKSLFSKEIKY